MTACKGLFLTVPGMLDELIAAGTGEQVAGTQLMQAIEDGAITLLDAHEFPKSEAELRAVAIRLIQAYLNRAHAPSEGLYEALYLKKVRALRAQFERLFGFSSDEDGERRNASELKIRTTIKAVYDAAHEAGSPPPNIKVLPKVVLAKLHDEGLHASERQIAKIGGTPEFAKRRRPVGKTFKSGRCR